LEENAVSRIYVHGRKGTGKVSDLIKDLFRKAMLETHPVTFVVVCCPCICRGLCSTLWKYCSVPSGWRQTA
jgi:hypothetical protein